MEGKIGKRLAAQGTVEKEDDEQRKCEGGHIKDAANALPARLQRVVKDLLGH